MHVSWECIRVPMTDIHENRTDETLAQQAARGDRAAFECIVHRYAGRLIQFVTGRTGAVHDAEDIVQETFLRCYQHIDSFDGRYPFKNWLYTIAYRTTVSAFRKKWPVLVSHDAVTKRADELTKTQSAESRIWSLVSEMKPDDHTVLWLRYKQDMDIDQIAKVMNKTQSGVRVHLHRARNRLAIRLKAAEQTASVPNIRMQERVTMERVK